MVCNMVNQKSSTNTRTPEQQDHIGDKPKVEPCCYQWDSITFLIVYFDGPIYLKGERIKLLIDFRKDSLRSSIYENDSNCIGETQKS